MAARGGWWEIECSKSHTGRKKNGKRATTHTKKHHARALCTFDVFMVACGKRKRTAPRRRAAFVGMRVGPAPFDGPGSVVVALGVN